jgi:energy-converting hydrogenase Eha subunit H
MYEDVLIETEEVKLALKRLPPEILNAREQRLKRAMVLSSQIKTVRGMLVGGSRRTDP